MGGQKIPLSSHKEVPIASAAKTPNTVTAPKTEVSPTSQYNRLLDPADEPLPLKPAASITGHRNTNRHRSGLRRKGFKKYRNSAVDNRKLRSYSFYF